MTPELRDFVETHKFELPAVKRVVEMLPADDAELDALIGQVVDAGHQEGFVFIVAAALLNERVVDGKHLKEGACLMPNGHYLAQMFWHMQGDKVAALTHALTHQVISTDIQVYGLLALAGWCRKHHEGVWPPTFLWAARQTARRTLRKDQQPIYIHALAAFVGDPDLLALVDEHQGHAMQNTRVMETSRKLAEATLATFELSMDTMMPETTRLIATGTHIRRAVARHGRNDPCHCGSGQKYKRCCHDKDQERARFPSEVAGKTQSELAAAREPHLTPESVQKLNRGHVRKLDPLKISEAMLPYYLMVLCSHGLHQEAATAFEKLGWREQMEIYEDSWIVTVRLASLGGDAEATERLIRVRYPDGKVPEGTLRPGTELLRLKADPAAYLDRLDHLVFEILHCHDAESQELLGCALIQRHHPALSLLLIQGLLPIISKQTAMVLMRLTVKLRDQLLLPAEDPFAEILERRFAESAATHQGKDAQKLREANDRLQVKAGEAREAKEELERLRRELRLREKAMQRAATTDSAPPSPVDQEALRHLRQKVETQQGTISGYTQERAQLRQELATAYSELQEYRKQQPASVNATEAADQHDEEALLLPAMMASNQPLRLLEYPKKFHETLTALPRQVSRAAQVLLGRLSAGEPSAFVGIVALRARPDTLRLRVGSDHRLIFRLHAATLEVVDLINRRDLDRCVKGLS